MLNFCTGVTCRHQAITEYFGQQLDGDSCGACDVCLGELDLVDDPLIVGQKILSCVLRLQQRFGGDYTAKVLSGSQEQRIVQQGHHQLSTWNILGSESLRTIRDWIEQLVSQDFMQKVGEYNVLHVTPLGRRLLKGEVTPRLLRPASASKAVRPASDVDSWDGVDRGLFESLRVLRQERAAAQNVPAYIVFSDAALRDMARRRPSTPEGFRQVRGVGEKKLEDYAAAFVGRITEYCSEHQLTTDVQPEPVAAVNVIPRSVPGPTASALGAFKLFRQGLSPEQAAQQLGRAASTTHGYLIDYIRHEKITDALPWVDPATIQRVVRTAGQVGTERLKPIYELLGGTIPYEQIRIVVECQKNALVERPTAG
jgi:ATP-dependent DNA helicase RecQ